MQNGFAAHLTNNQFFFLGEVVLWDLEVQRRGPLADAAGDVVVGAVAGAKPTTVVARLADGDTAEMCADAWKLRVMLASPSIQLVCPTWILEVESNIVLTNHN